MQNYRQLTPEKRIEAWDVILVNAKENGDENAEALMALKKLVFEGDSVILETLSEHDDEYSP